MPTPIDMAPIVAVTRFKPNPSMCIVPYNQITTNSIGIIVTTAYFSDRIKISKSINVAVVAIGIDNCNDLGGLYRYLKMFV